MTMAINLPLKKEDLALMPQAEFRALHSDPKNAEALQINPSKATIPISVRALTTPCNVLVIIPLATGSKLATALITLFSKAGDSMTKPATEIMASAKGKSENNR